MSSARSRVISGGSAGSWQVAGCSRGSDCLRISYPARRARLRTPCLALSSMLRLLCRDDEEGRAMALVGEARLRPDLRLARAPLIDVRYRESGPQHQVDRGCQGAVLL